LNVPNDTVENYIRFSRKRRFFILTMIIMTVTVSVVTIRMGSSDISYAEILRILVTGRSGGDDGEWHVNVVRNLRLPMIVAAILVGSALGIAGAAMQSILRNPLASPFTLGLSNASAFGAAVGILAVTGGTAAQWLTGYGAAVTVVFAFTFSMLATAVVVLLIKFTDTTPETIVLAGLAISAIFAAGLAFMQYIADDVQLSTMVFWQFGSLDNISWNEILILAAASFIAAAYFIFKRFDYNVMEAGDETAASLGVDASGTRVAGLTMSAMVTAVAVSFAGIIGFVGLLAPHVVRRMIGSDNRYLLIGSMLVGALVLLIANMISQHAFGVFVPIGIITSAVGGPIFLYILIRGHRNAPC
jgi:iron complex transport system permease protein